MRTPFHIALAASVLLGLGAVFAGSWSADPTGRGEPIGPSQPFAGEIALASSAPFAPLVY